VTVPVGRLRQGGGVGGVGASLEGPDGTDRVAGGVLVRAVVTSVTLGVVFGEDGVAVAGGEQVVMLGDGLFGAGEGVPERGDVGCGDRREGEGCVGAVSGAGQRQVSRVHAPAGCGVVSVCSSRSQRV